MIRASQSLESTEPTGRADTNLPLIASGLPDREWVHALWTPKRVRNLCTESMPDGSLSVSLRRDSKVQLMTTYVLRIGAYVEAWKIHSVFSSHPPSRET